MVNTRGSKEDPNEDKNEEDSPSVDPDLRKTRSEAEIGSDGRCRIWSQPWRVLSGVVFSHFLVAGGQEWREVRKSRLLGLLCGRHDGGCRLEVVGDRNGRSVAPALLVCSSFVRC